MNKNQNLQQILNPVIKSLAGVSSNSQKKNKRKKVRSRRRQPSSLGSTTRNGVSLAPAGVSSSGRTAMRYESRGNNLVTKGRIEICQVGHAAVNVQTVKDALHFRGGSAYAMNCTFGTTNPLGSIFSGSGSPNTHYDYVSPFLDLIGSAYSQYKVHKLKFIYLPTDSSIDTDTYTFAWSEDPLNPNLSTTLANSDNATILQCVEDCVTFAGWNQWEMDVSHTLDKKFYYNYDDPGSGIITSEDAEFTRFSCPGIFACIVTTSEGAPTKAQVGTLWAEFEIEFKSISPCTQTYPSLDLLSKRIRSPAFALSCRRNPDLVVDFLKKASEEIETEMRLKAAALKERAEESSRDLPVVKVRESSTPILSNMRKF
jgi:hypothetical protein